MELRPTHYKFVPSQVDSLGATVLRYPFPEIWDHYERGFHRTVIEHLCTTHGHHTSQLELLDQAHLTHEAICLDEWFQDYRPPILRFRWDVETLTKLALTADDLAHDDGQWKSDALDLDRPIQTATAEIRRRIQNLRRLTQAESGPDAAVGTLEALRTNWLTLRTEWIAPVDWTTRHADELQDTARILRNARQPRQFHYRTLLSLRARLSPRRWLTESERQMIERRLFPRIQRAGELRFEQELRRRRCRIADAILGRPGAPGILDQILQEVESDRTYFKSLTNVSHRARIERASREPDEILLVESLDTVIDADGQRTLLDLYDELVHRSGCTPARLAEQLLAQGLSIEGRRYLPAEWPSLPLPHVQQGLQAVVAGYLGSSNRRTPVRIDQPQTAFDHAATITPMSPELAAVLRAALPLWIRQSKPYAEHQHLNGADPSRHAFLFCYPPDRRRWESLLVAHVRMSNGDVAVDDAVTYATAHPYVAILCHYAGFPAGGLRSLPSWILHNQQLRQQGRLVPQVDPSNYPEMRRLSHRPDDAEDCRQLFQSALKANVIVPLAGATGQFTIAFEYEGFDKSLGLSQSGFESNLLVDDDLYNFVFWRVRDALDKGQLTAADVPLFVRNFSSRSH